MSFPKNIILKFKFKEREVQMLVPLKEPMTLKKFMTLNDEPISDTLNKIYDNFDMGDLVPHILIDNQDTIILDSHNISDATEIRFF